MTTENNDYSFTLADDGPGVKMVAIGTGGMGNNAMENLARAAITGLDLYSLNTDVQPLRHCRGSKPVQLGAKRTRGKGAGGDSEMGRLSAEDDAEKIRKIVRDAELVFIASGMGGGTGTGAAPVIARICREMGVLSICVVTMPMECEGGKRAEKARAGLAELRKTVDSLLIIENEKLSKVMENEDVSIIEVFRRADKVVVDAVVSVARIINSHGYINLDLADLKKVIKRGEKESCVDAFIGVGEACGPDRAMKAAEMALNNPLMREGSIYGAVNLLVNVIGSDQMGHKEAMAAVKSIVDAAGDLDREIFMGVVPDNTMGDKLSITVIATGLANRNATVVPLRATGTQEKKERVGGIEAANARNTRNPTNSGSEKARICVSESANEVDIASDLETLKKVSDGFGFSPLIRKDEWLAPAYLRCCDEPSKINETLVKNPERKIVLVDNGGEGESGLDNFTDSNQYRQALYHMAS
ncbi:MAG: cell division protein FtsZ [Desulfobulbaceae bacterium]|nr:cell division protein FtsZ [Desulfobulbaceae bacterium]